MTCFLNVWKTQYATCLVPYTGALIFSSECLDTTIQNHLELLLAIPKIALEESSFNVNDDCNPWRIHARRCKDKRYGDEVSKGCTNRLWHLLTPIYLLISPYIMPPSKSHIWIYLHCPSSSHNLGPFCERTPWYRSKWIVFVDSCFLLFHFFLPWISIRALHCLFVVKHLLLAIVLYVTYSSAY